VAKPVSSESFISDITRVLSEGAANSTLKWLLLLAVVDASPTFFGGPDEVSCGTIADSAFKLLKPQTRPFPLTGNQLSQIPHSGMRHGLLDLVGAERSASPSDETRREIAWQLAQWPVPRLQRIGGVNLRFLWNTPEVWEEWFATRRRTAHPVPKGLFETGPDRLPRLEFLPGAVDCLVRLGPLIRPAVEIRWTDQVSKMNKHVLPHSDSVKDFLFPPTQRVGFNRCVKALSRVQDEKCFWCEEPLDSESGRVVDHVVPWSLSQNNAIQNLVITHARCNLLKSNWLPGPSGCARWMGHLKKNSAALSQVALDYRLLSDEKLAISWMKALYGTVPLHGDWRAFEIVGGTPGVFALDPADAVHFFDSH
jgi:hypothetical protein